MDMGLKQKRTTGEVWKDRIAWLGFFAGPLLGLLAALGLPNTYQDGSGSVIAIQHAARITAGLGVWMAVWWLSEAVHISATALLPLVILPLFGAAEIKVVATSYGHELIFLFMGGFFLSKAMERWGLHRRIALITLRFFGGGQRVMIGGFMLVTAVLSAWVSNTATAIMMLPIALSVIDTVAAQTESKSEGDRFALALMLGIAYSASIGGVATLIGSPPNLFLASFLRDQLNVELGFVEWFKIGFPIAVVFLPLTWFLLTRVLVVVSPQPLPGGKAMVEQAYQRLGAVNRGSLITLVVFLCTALLWLSRPTLVGMELGGRQPFAGLTDAGIAVLAGVLLFCIPVSPNTRVFVLDWDTAVKLPWGILILFGGGLSLAAAVQANGLGDWIGSLVQGWQGMPVPVLICCVAAMIIFLTEMTSNTATSATLIPILAAIAGGMAIDPLLLVFPAALAASMAFMMPVATPPNAIVFGSGRVTIPQMARAGFWLNLIGVVLVTLVSWFWVPVVM